MPVFLTDCRDFDPLNPYEQDYLETRRLELEPKSVLLSALGRKEWEKLRSIPESDRDRMRRAREWINA